MKKNILSIVLLLFTTVIIAQKNQRIAYIDMEYILKNIPEYIKAQNSLDAKVEKWKTKLNKEAKEIETLKTDLANEKAILTKDLIEEREEDITIKEDALRKLNSLYFGPNGDMYNLRKRLIQPVQDQVYNSVQTIAKRKKYDFVFDKSSDLIMLYSNKKHDISDLVVKLISIEQKRQARIDKIAEKKRLLKNDDLSDKQKEKLKQQEAIKQKRIAQKKARIEAIQKRRDNLRKKREEYKKKKRKN